MQTLVFSLIALVVVAGCSGEQARRTAYEAAMQKQCAKETGVPGCATPKPSYDDYQREREKTLAK